MPRDDDLDERELPDESDMDEDPDGTPTDDCPHCGAEIHADTDICPKCGSFTSREDAPPQQRDRFWIVTIVLVTLLSVLVLLWLTR